MIFKLFPKEYNFFDLFEKQAAFALEAARQFRMVVGRGMVDEATLEKIIAIEHDADDVAHDIIHQLNKTFITPFDREDIHALAKELDDVVDMITTITNRMMVYKLTGINKNLVEFARLIEESAQSVQSAVKGLRNMKDVSVALEEINRLENLGDTLRDNSLAELFDNEKDPIAVIKWKEIYQDTETVLDICEDVAHVVGSILVKQA
jgi:predicted phosphate transport protein (TIGR00153 family)